MRVVFRTLLLFLLGLVPSPGATQAEEAVYRYDEFQAAYSSLASSFSDPLKQALERMRAHENQSECKLGVEEVYHHFSKTFPSLLEIQNHLDESNRMYFDLKEFNYNEPDVEPPVKDTFDPIQQLIEQDQHKNIHEIEETVLIYNPNTILLFHEQPEEFEATAKRLGFKWIIRNVSATLAYDHRPNGFSKYFFHYYRVRIACDEPRTKWIKKRSIHFPSIHLRKQNPYACPKI